MVQGIEEEELEKEARLREPVAAIQAVAEPGVAGPAPTPEVLMHPNRPKERDEEGA
jgi:hypothetical protein